VSFAEKEQRDAQRQQESGQQFHVDLLRGRIGWLAGRETGWLSEWVKQDAGVSFGKSPAR
jgi:hypothetical protein